MVRVIALLLTVLTGFSGLVYQVAWQKYLAVLLGSHSEATAAVLGIFLGGLSYGYLLLGRVSERLVARGREKGRPAGLVRVYGLLEVGIGLWALLFPVLFAGVQVLSLASPPGLPGLAFAIDVGLTVLLIGPPTVMMGGTIPLLTQGLSRSLEDASRLHALVYSFNTAGAFFGALCAGFFLVPWLGLRDSVLAMGLVNLGAGLCFVMLARREGLGTVVPIAEPSAAAGRSRGGVGVYAVVALLAGFAMMTLQTAMNRLGALALGASHFTFAMIVATFVLCIALGSFGVSALRRIPRFLLPVTQWGLALYLLALYPLLEDAPYWAHWLRSRFPLDDAAFYPFQFAVFGSILAVFVVPLALSGATLPLLFHHLKDRMGELGGVAGRLYSINTLGSLLGALLGGYALYFWLDLHEIYRVIVVCSALAAALVSREVWPGGRFAFAAGLAVLVVAVALQSAWRPVRLASGLFRGRVATERTGMGADAFFEPIEANPARYFFYDDDPAMSVAVRGLPIDAERSFLAVKTNGKSDGVIPADNLTMGLASLLPALLASRAERAFVIGYGTGMTVGTLNALETIERVTVAEISHGVMDAAPLFDPRNGGALKSPKVEVIRSDAYRALLRSRDRYDVIVSEPSNPWVTGVEMLFSVEFLRAARERLSPGGVYAQWFHVYETNDETIGLVLRTCLAAFDHVAVWVALPNDFLILGFNAEQPDLDLQRLEARFERPDFRRAFRGLGITTFLGLLSHERLPIDVASALPLPEAVHTILHPTLSHTAARAFFVGGQGDLPAISSAGAAAHAARNSLLGRALARRAVGDEGWSLVFRETCVYMGAEACAVVAARWRLAEPRSSALRSALAQARRQPVLTEALRPETLIRLEALLDPVHASDLAASAETAQELVDLSRRYAHPAFPFSDEAIRQVFAGCIGDPRCAQGLQDLRARTGDESNSP